MWTNEVLVQVSFCVIVAAVPGIAQFRSHIHSELDFEPHIQIVETNDALVEQFHARAKRDNFVDSAKSRVRRDVAALIQSEKEKEDAEFRRELRELFRDTRATYAGVTKLLHRQYATKKKNMMVPQDSQLLAYNVNSEQFEQILKSSAELARDGTRLPLWGIATPKDYSPVATSPVDVVRELRALLRDTCGTYAATTKLIEREHTKSVKKMVVPREQVLIDYGVNSQQLAEIIKSSEERDPAVWPLIGMTTPNVTFSTASINFIRELRNLFRDTRATYATTSKLPHQAGGTPPRRQLKVNKDPLLAKYQVNSRQIEEILKSSEERAKDFPLIGDGKCMSL